MAWPVGASGISPKPTNQPIAPINSLRAVESIIDDNYLINESSHSPDYVSSLRVTAATVAVALGRLGEAMGASVAPAGSSSGCCGGNSGAIAALCAAAPRGWQQLKGRLRAGIKGEEVAYWQGLLSANDEKPMEAWSLCQVGLF